MSDPEKKKEATENKVYSSEPVQSTTESKENSELESQSCPQTTKTLESDEDIPGDFFDDFLKEDFMAGLDIVDDDEWEEGKIKLDVETAEKPKDTNTLEETSQTETTKKRKKEKSSRNDRKLPEEKLSKQKRKRYEERGDEAKHKKNSDKPIDADEFDIRRDPEKTKRDIARDKVRCEKDKEMKMISEKLSLVETGLVPPGMEMEIDIEEIKKQKEKIENKSPRDLREHLKDLKGKNRSPARRPRSPFRKRSPRKSPNGKKISPMRKHSRSSNRDLLVTTRSAASPIRRRSPFRRTSPRRFSPLRRRSPAYLRRRSRSHSPMYRNRRRAGRSSSRDSDRERWLKRRNRSRSRSPRRKRDEKKSFLQEIAEKLNEIRQPMNIVPQMQAMPPMQPILQPMQPTLRYVEPQTLPAPVPAPTPVPAPAPVPMFPTPQQYDPYDQSFFIGAPQAATLNSFSGPSLPGPPMPMVSPGQPTNSLATRKSLTPGPVNPSTPNLNVSFPSGSSQVAGVAQLKPKLETQEDIAKLFQDKQISLSEFLAITAKPEVFSSSPSHLQEKIKVITRCHDAIKILESSEKKYCGKLVVRKTNKYNITPSNCISPLKEIPQVQFPFTNPTVSLEEQKTSFTDFANGLLKKLGLLTDTMIAVADETADIAPVTERRSIHDFSPPPPPLITPSKNPVQKDKRFKSFVETNRLSKMVQTEAFKCESCEKRKKIITRVTGVQTSTATVTFSVSTQVTEEELPARTIPKTLSLAALTPAQLLAKSRESLNAATRASRIDVDKFDIHTSGFHRPNFFRGAENYGSSRPNPPFSSTIYDDLDSQMYEGGNRGRESYPPRALEPNSRFNHNNYY